MCDSYVVWALHCGSSQGRAQGSRHHRAGYPDDPFFPLQWALHNTGQFGGTRGDDVRALAAWRITKCSPSVLIAVVDSGVDARQADLAGKASVAKSFVSGSALTDDRGHGIAVAAIASAWTNNGRGIAGVCPLGRIMSVKVSGRNGKAPALTVARGIRWAVNHGARVINVSLGGRQDDIRSRSAAMYAYSRGALIIAGAGNSGRDSMEYPADDPHVLAVGPLITATIGGAGQTMANKTWSSRPV